MRREVPTIPPAPPRIPRARSSARGFSLIIAMLMLAVIGLASAAIMRNATSGDQVANNNRLQTQANQYAQLAMRWCERQLALDAGSRAAPVLAATNPPAWTSQQNWTAAGGAHAAHTLGAKDIGSAVQPRIFPQCLMESTSTADVYTVTARGFSADYKADPGTGATRNGSSAWLQATIHAEGENNGPLNVRQRLWQQLLTPPF
jgi:type IV pilus assembly protein PilX